MNRKHILILILCILDGNFLHAQKSEKYIPEHLSANHRGPLCNSECVVGVDFLNSTNDPTFDPKKAFDEMLKHAKECPITALFSGIVYQGCELQKLEDGGMILLEQGTPVSQAERFDWAYKMYSIAFERGAFVASFHLAQCYEFGIGCEPAHKSRTSASRCFDFYNKCFDCLSDEVGTDGERPLDHPNSFKPLYMGLARCYENGWGHKKDSKLKRVCYEEACKLGSVEALYFLGMHYKQKATSFFAFAEAKKLARNKARILLERYLERESKQNPIKNKASALTALSELPLLTSHLPLLSLEEIISPDDKDAPKKT